MRFSAAVFGAFFVAQVGAAGPQWTGNMEGAVLLRGSARLSPVAPGDLPPFGTGKDGVRFMRFRFEGEHVRVHFADFRLPSGAAVYVTGVDESGAVMDRLGPFERTGPTVTGDFWVSPARGRTCVEFQVPAGEVPPDLPFRVVEIAPAAVTEVQGPSAPPAVEVRTSFYRGRNITHEVVNGVGIFEQDIVLGPAGQLQPARPDTVDKDGRRESTGVPGLQYRWPNGVMPYEIDPALPDQARIRNGVDHWNRMLGGVVQLVPHNRESNYVVYQRPDNAGNCSSYVGMQGGRQAISIGDFCGSGNVIHETGHALGLWHEQARNDRDQHVRVLWDNIQSGLSFNFDKTNEKGEDLGEYDFASIMHYNAYAFSANGLPTIETIPAGVPIGQRDTLSTGDISGIRVLYGAPVVAGSVDITIASNPGGLAVAVDGETVTTPYLVRWQSGSEHTISAPESLVAGGVHMSFVRWSDGGDATHRVTAGSTDPVFSADFARSYRVAAAAAPEQGGTVKVSPTSPDGYYVENQMVSLQPQPKPGYCFAGWSGLLPGAPARASLIAAKPYEPAANFQPGAYTVSRSLDYVGKQGGDLRLDVTANSGCVWDASAASDWVTIAAPGGGSGNGSVNVAVAPNNTGHGRIATVHILNRSWVIVQTPD